MKIIVTGGTGFIGRYVVAEAQARGHHAQAFSRKDHDLRELAGLAQKLTGADVVIHCAASLAGGPAEQEADTVLGTTNLLAAMREAGVRQVVGLSTFALYDYQAVPADSALTEDSPLEEHYAARGPYILAKRKQEDLIRAAGAADGLRFTLVRPGIVYGPGRTWFHHLGMQLGATRWVCLAGDSLFPITHVESCASAIVLAAERKEAHGATLNLVDDDLPKRSSYVQALAERTRPTPSITYVPWSILDASAKTASFFNRALMLGRAPLPGLLQPASLDARCKPLTYPNARAKQVLGWTPRSDFREGLERSFER